MKKLLMMVVLSLCFTGLAHAGHNSFSFTIVGPGYAISAGHGMYPYPQFYPMVPPPVIMAPQPMYIYTPPPYRPRPIVFCNPPYVVVTPYGQEIQQNCHTEWR